MPSCPLPILAQILRSSVFQLIEGVPMKDFRHSKGLVFKKTVVARTLAVAFGAMSLAGGISTTALAQSNTTGNIFGQATAGATSVVIENTGTGAKRTLTPDANGRFLATTLPPGQYKVQSLVGSSVVGTSEVDVSVGQGAEVSFAPTGNLATVQVIGTKKAIDVSSTNNGATFTAKQLASLPVGKNVESIIQLAPNTTRADTRFAGGASFGGGAASENSYYINGFPVVNPLTGLGASQLPFGAIAEAQVITGGFGAEFGRSVGGVVNVITKSGTNRWEAGVSYSISPNSLRSKSKDIYYVDTKVYNGGLPYNNLTDGTLRLARAENTSQQVTTSAYMGGPLIQDKLFFFGAFENVQLDTGRVVNTRIATSNAENGWRDENTNTKRYLTKFDWNLTDNHRLELTAIGDTPIRSIADSGYDYATRQRVGTVTSRQTLTNIDDNGGELKMLKYTGNLTPDLTLTALTGRSNSKHTNEFPNYDPSLVLFSSVSDPSVRAEGFGYANPQAITGNVLAPGSEDIVKSTRLDLEYQLGKHTIRFGLDKNEITSNNAGEFKAGGGTWTFLATDTPSALLDTASGTTVPGPAANGGLGAQGYYVRQDLFTDVTSSYGVQEAQYIEDKFQITKDLLLTAGVRRESFRNINDAGKTFLDNKPQLLPRFAAAWDVNGDASLKLFGTFGRYSVPIPTHIAVRGAGRSTFTERYYTYTGVDATTGAPTGLQELGVGPFSGNNEYGQDKVVETLSAVDLKPSYQDDFTLGFEKAYSPTLNFGGKVTYRALKSTIDDFCDVRPFAAYAAAHEITITNPLWGNTCQTFNPGQDNVFKVQYGADPTNLTTVPLTKAQQGFDAVKRTYTALDLFLEHPLKNGWYGKLNYTWSRNVGNTEGQVRSDNGQADVAVTSVWDYPELMAGADGRLPNDRTHQIKAFGFLEVTNEWGVGANVLIATGRPRSCIGSAPSNPNGSPDYVNQTFYCLGVARSSNVLTPRGTIGNLPTDSRLDMNISYKPSVMKGLQLKMDVFNVFNAQTVQNVEERYNNGTRVRSTYETPLSLTAPRSVKLTASYDYKF
jgi:hypothetical protein